MWTVEHHAVPLVSFLVLLPIGSAADPRERPGLAAITGDMLDEGCGDLNAIELHETLGRIGGAPRLRDRIGRDHPDADDASRASPIAAPALLADMLIRPRLEPRDFDRVRDLRLNRLVQLRDMAPALADRAFAQLLYPNHPYGHLPIGTEGSLRAMTLREVGVVPSLDVRPVPHDGDRVRGRVARGAGGSRRARVRRAGRRPATRRARRIRRLTRRPSVPQDRVALLHRPAAAQSELRIGHVAVARDTPDYHALLVLNMVLGGQFVSRINMNLREDKGYTYGARTSFDFRRGPGPFALHASVQSEVTVDAILEALSELRADPRRTPGDTRKELETGRAGLTRGYPRNFETAEQISRGAAQLALYGLPDDYFSTFVPRVLAVDEADVTRVAAEHIDPSRFLIVIVGDRDKVGPALPRLNLGTPLEVAPG